MLWVALLLACSVPALEKQSQTTMIELPPFEDPEVASAYQRYLEWAEARGWTSTALRRRGSRLERTWIHGQPGDGELPSPGAARLALSVFASTRAERSYGLQWSAEVADDAGRALSVLVVSGAKSVTPDQVRIDARQGADAAVALGAPLDWKVGERVLKTQSPSGLTEVQAKLAAYSGEGFAEEGAKDLGALEALVRPVLDSGDYSVCDYGPSPGRGIPGPCLPRAPNQAEREASDAAFTAEIERRRSVLESAGSWAGLLDSVVPPR